MPKIKFTQEYKRGHKVIKAGATMDVTWEGYEELYGQGLCEEIKRSKKKKAKATKKKTAEVPGDEAGETETITFKDSE